MTIKILVTLQLGHLAFDSASGGSPTKKIHCSAIPCNFIIACYYILFNMSKLFEYAFFKDVESGALESK